jgi:hypothetical protein
MPAKLEPRDVARSVVQDAVDNIGAHALLPSRDRAAQSWIVTSSIWNRTRSRRTLLTLSP